MDLMGFLLKAGKVGRHHLGAGKDDNAAQASWMRGLLGENQQNFFALGLRMEPITLHIANTNSYL